MSADPPPSTPPLAANTVLKNYIEKERRRAAWDQYWVSRAVDVSEQAHAGDRRLPEATQMIEEVDQLLLAACEALVPTKLPSRWSRMKLALSGAHRVRAIAAVNLAEAQVLRIATQEQLAAAIPRVVMIARSCLPYDDLRRQGVERLEAQRLKLRSDDNGDIEPADLELLNQTLRAANREYQTRWMRLHNFAVAVAVATLIVFVADVAVVVLGALNPDFVPLCFYPPGEASACPTGPEPEPADHAIVAGIGALAATLAAAFALRSRVRGTSIRAVPLALAIFKLPVGALTATLGILLMRGNFVPGLTALDDPAQILAWAVVFGYSQELFTSFVDKQAHALTVAAGGETGSIGPT